MNTQHKTLFHKGQNVIVTHDLGDEIGKVVGMTTATADGGHHVYVEFADSTRSSWHSDVVRPYGDQGSL